MISKAQLKNNQSMNKLKGVRKMSKRLKKPISIIVALTMLLSMLSMTSLSAYAEQQPAGYVTISVDANTLGAGFLYEPLKVPFYEGDDYADITQRFLGSGNYKGTGGAISAIKLQNPIDVKVSQVILDALYDDWEIEEQDILDEGRSDAAYLSAGDYDYFYGLYSGWTYSVNTDFPSVGAADLTPQDGDVCRWQFTLYGLGADLGQDIDWGPGYQFDRFYDAADMSELLAKLGEINAATDQAELLAQDRVGLAYDQAVALASNLTVSQTWIDKALVKLNAALAYNAPATYNWPNFRGNDENNAVVDYKTPRNADEAELYWAVKKGSGYGGAAIGSPIIVDDYLVFPSGTSLFKQNRYTGEILYDKVGTLAGSSAFNIVPPTYADGMIFVPLNNGIIQAFDAETLESLWVYKDPLKGQGNTVITYHDGYVYTGYWGSETKEANLVCVSVKDEDPTNTLEEKTATWTYTHAGGFYWAGSYVTDDFLLVGTDDGQGGYTSKTAKLLSLNPKTGAVIDKIDDICSDIRSCVSYDKDTDRYYFTSKSGGFYSVKVGVDGKFAKDVNGLKGYDLKELVISPMDNSVGMLTSTPAIANGRAYVGIGASNQFGVYAGHCIAVIDLETFTLAYRARTKGYPQTSGLVTTAYSADDGYNYVYFNENYTPGIIRVLKDKAGQTAIADPATEKNGANTYTDCAPALFTPSGSQAQYSLASVIVDPEGTLYFKNDSAHMMAVGSRIQSITVTTAPTKTVYKDGDTFDATGMKVVANLANGLKRDITKTVKFSNTPLTLSDTDVTVKYDIVMYHDTMNAGAANTGGVASVPLETTVNITVLSEIDKASLSEVEDLIDAIGTVTLDSETAIGTARAAYEGLDEDLQDLVSNYGTLTAAESTLATLKAAAELAAAKTTAKTALDNYVNPADYRTAEQTALATAVSDGKAAIDAATTLDGVAQALAAAKTTINGIKTNAQLTAEELLVAKNTAKSELSAYKNSADYRTAQQTELATAISNGSTAIDAATTVQGVNDALSAAKTIIDGIKTNSQMTAEELSAAKTSAKLELSSYKNSADYRAAQQTELSTEIANGNTAIDSATTVQGVNNALAAAKTVIDAIKTNAQLTAEENAALLQGAKTTAKSELASYKNSADYRSAQQTELATAISNGNLAIDGATTEQGVADALAAAKAVINSIKTDAQLTEEEAAAVLASAKTSAKSELDAYKNSADYRTAQKTELATAISNGKTAIGAATTVQGVNDALAAAKTVIDGIKTDAQLTAEEKPAFSAKDSDTQIDVSADAGVVPAGAVLVAKPINDGDAYNGIKITLGDTVDKFIAYDIYMLLDDSHIQPDGKVTIKIPVPAGYDVNELILYYVADDGLKEAIAHTVTEEDGKHYVTFSTTHFSSYVLAQKLSKDGNNTDIPQTGDTSNPIMWVILALSSGAVLVLNTRKKKTARI